VNWRTVRVLWAHELRMLLRDRRTVVVAIVLPLLVMPLMFFASRTMNEKRKHALEGTLYQYAVTGAEADGVRALVAAGREAVAAAPAEPAPAPGGGPAPAAGASGDPIAALRLFRSEETRVEDPAAALAAKTIHFYIEGLSPAEADALPPEPDPDKEDEEKQPDDKEKRTSILADPVRLPGVPVARIVFQADRDSSSAGRARMRDLLAEGRRALRDRMLRDRGLGADPAAVFAVEETSLATPAQVTGSWVGRFLTLFLMMFMLTGGSVVAMDIVAGEKERGSLETLLTTAAGRNEIVAAKQCTILTVGAAITLIQAANILAYMTFRLIPMPEDFVLEAPPRTVVTLLLLFLPVAALVASVLLTISAYAKTYKEAQLYFFPVYLLSLVPPLVAVLPGVSLRSIIALVPVANVSVAVREIMVGRFDWPMIGVVFLATLATAVVAVRQSAKLLSNERLITASDTDAADIEGGPALFPRHVLRWYGIMAVLMLAVALNVPALQSFRRQLLFNELAIFILFPILMIRRYRLDPRRALALRLPHPLAWLAVLVIIPCGLLTGTGVFRLANFVIPVPREMLEQFSREILPKGIPFWQIVLGASVLPGICEEIAFRGTLLHGLRRRFRPVTLALVIGLIFGLFHVSLFRIAPTGFLGVVLTGVALLTGSIFPGMVAHAGNNALALWLGSTGHSVSGLDWWAYVLGAIGLAVGFAILYRVRTPYPELRTPRR
jgi:sodium transport system permease protein